MEPIMQTRGSASRVRLTRGMFAVAWGVVAVVGVSAAKAQTYERIALVDESVQFTAQPGKPSPSAIDESPMAPSAVAEDGDVKPLDRVNLDVLPPVGKFPERPSDTFFERSLENPGVAQRMWSVTPVAWHASNLAHRPLYFEQVALERYGHTLGPGVQTAVSAAHFFTTIPFLPYKMTLEPPYEHIYALGYYRPGSYAPKLRYRVPFRLDAILVEAGAAGAVAAILP